MGDVRSKEEGMCKQQSVNRPQKSSPKVRKDESMGKWINNTKIIDRAKNSMSKKEFVMSRWGVAVE